MNARRIGQLLILGVVLGCASAVWAEEPLPRPVHTDLMSSGQVPVYVGTYTRGSSKGIYLYRLNLDSGELTPVGCVGEVANPSFLALHPTRPLLYAVSEVSTFEGQKGGALSAFAIEPTSGKLTLLNQRSSQGTSPCHLMVDPSGKCVVVANYGTGTAACLPIQDDGRLGEAASVVQHEGSGPTSRQKAPHAHGVNMDAAGRFVFVNDLGIDKVMIYSLDAGQGKLTANDPPFFATAAGAGPRHMVFHPDGRHAYVINELNATITAAVYDADRGSLRMTESISTLPEGYKGPSTAAEVEVHPSGKFVYGTTRGPDDVAIFAVDPESGVLRLVGHEPAQGKTPRSFAIDPSGRYLLVANQDGNNIVVFRINPETGLLRAVGSPVELHSPVCVKMTSVVR